MYARDGVSVSVVPGAVAVPPSGFTGRPLPSFAPPRTHAAIRNFSSGVSSRRDEPRSAGESAPGIQGGIVPFWVRRRIACAYPCAESAEVRENGATPPS